jgi:hypothetical protein
MRAFNASSASGNFLLGVTDDPATSIGQSAMRSPSVFNFFRPGYVPPGTALAATGATAPEFQIVNESSVSQWVNAIESWVFSGIYVVWPDKPGLPNPYQGPYPGDGFDITTQYPNEVALAADPVALVRRLNMLLAAGQVSEATLQRIVEVLREQNVTDNSTPQQKRWRVVAAITLLMCCPEYLVQK